MESEWTTEFEEPRTIKDHINRHLAQKEFDLRRNKMEKLHQYIEDINNVTVDTDITDDNFTSISQRPPNLVNNSDHVNLSVPYTDMVTHKLFWQAQPVVNLKKLTETSVQNYKELLNNKNNNSRLQNSSIYSFNVQSKYYENPIILKNWYPFLSSSGKLSFQAMEADKPITTDYVVYRYSTKRFADAQGVVYLLSGQLKYHSNIPKYIYENFCAGLPYSWKEINLEWIEYIKNGSSVKFQWGKSLKDKNFNMIQKNDESVINSKVSSPVRRHTNVQDINSPENYTFDFNRPSIIGGHVNSTPLHVKQNYNKTMAMSGTNTTMSRSNKSVSSVQVLEKKIAKLQAMLEVAKQRELLCDDSIVSEMQSMEIQKTKLNRMEKLKNDKRPFAHLNLERDKEFDEKSKINEILDERTKDSSVFKVPSSIPLSMTLLRRKNIEEKTKTSQIDESSHKIKKIQYADVDVHKELYDTSYYKKKSNKTLKIVNSSDSDDDYNTKMSSRISKNDPVDLKRKYNPTDTPPPPNKKHQIEIVEARIGVTDTEACSFIDSDDQMSDSCDTFKTAKNSISLTHQKINKNIELNKNKIDESESINTTNKTKSNSINSYNLQKSKKKVLLDDSESESDSVSSNEIDNMKKNLLVNNRKDFIGLKNKNCDIDEEIKIKTMNRSKSSHISSTKELNKNYIKESNDSNDRKKIKPLNSSKSSHISSSTKEINKNYLKESNDSKDCNEKIKTMNTPKSHISNNKKELNNSNNRHEKIKTMNRSHISNNKSPEIPKYSIRISSDSEDEDSYESESNIKIVSDTRNKPSKNINTPVNKKKENSSDLRKTSIKNLMSTNSELNETYKKSSTSQFSEGVYDSDISLKEKMEHIISIITTISNSSKSNNNSDTPNLKKEPNTPLNKKPENNSTKKPTKILFSDENSSEDDEIINKKNPNQENLNKKQIESPVNIKLVDNESSPNYNLRRKNDIDEENILRSSKKLQNRKSKNLTRRDLLLSLKNELNPKLNRSACDNKIINLKSNKQNNTNKSKSNTNKNQGNRKSVRLVNYSLNTSSDLCTNSDEDDDDEDENNPSDKKNENTETIVLKNWRPEVETMYCSNCFVYVIGDKISVSGKLLEKNFKTAEITDRITNNKIKDVNNTIYILKGKMFDPKNNIPAKLKSILRNGFPTNAFEMMDKWYKTARESYEDIKNKINVSERDFNDFEEKLNASGISLIESDESDHSSEKSHKKQKKTENNKRREKKDDLEYSFTTVNNKTFNISSRDNTQSMLNITTMNNVNASRYGRIRKAPVNYWAGERFVCMKDQMYYKPPETIQRETKTKKLNQTYVKSSTKKLYFSNSSESSENESIKNATTPTTRSKSKIKTESNIKQSKRKSVENSTEKPKKKSPLKTEAKPNTKQIKKENERKLHDKRNKSKPNEKVISSKVIKNKDRQNNVKNIKDKINSIKKNKFEAKEKIDTSSDYTDSGIVRTPDSRVYNECYVILEKVNLESELAKRKEKNVTQTKTINKTFTKPKRHKHKKPTNVYDLAKYKCKRISAKKHFEIGTNYVTSDSDNASLVLETNNEQTNKKKRRLYYEQEWLFELANKKEDYFKTPMSFSDLSSDK